VRFDDRNFWDRDGLLTLSLRHADFTTATRVADELNRLWPGSTGARDAATILVRIPKKHYDMGDTARFVSEIENVRVATDMRTRLLINERTGTIVIGGDIHVHPAVVAHGNLSVSIKSKLAVSQPAPLSRGTTVVVEDVEATVAQPRASVMALPELVTVQELAATLNELGGSAQDLISILQSLRHLGAIQVEIETQ
jgi:flagellar P-ring protein precursor FlgI